MSKEIKEVKKQTKKAKKVVKKQTETGFCETCRNVRHRPRNVLRCAELDGLVVRPDSNCIKYKKL